MNNLSDKSLLKDVYQILDSRIQYIEYQLGKLSRQPFQKNPGSEHFEQEDIFSIERVFKQIELHNHSLKLLILLRSALTILNAPFIFQLLTDSKYLDFEESELKDLLGIDRGNTAAGERLFQSNG